MIVRPGITGLAQLHFGYDQSLGDVQRKIVLDLEYIRTIGFFQDVKILLVTVPRIAAKLMQKRKADSEPLNNDGNNDGDLEVVRPFASERAARDRRTDTTGSGELELHVPHLVIDPEEPFGLAVEQMPHGVPGLAD